jgi:type I restriction enzyme S subunit
MIEETAERGESPPGWAWVKLDDLGEWAGGGTPSKENRDFWRNGSIPWISPKDIKAEFVGGDAERITEAAVVGSATKLIEAGSILCVVRSGILRHTFPVAITDRTATVNQDLRALTPHSGVDARYIQLYLRSQNQRILHECSKDGTTVNSIDVGRLGRIGCPIAPTAEQRRIVAKIDELFGEIEAGEQELEKAREGFRRAVLKAAVTGELTREWREKNAPNETGADLLNRVLAERRAAWERAEIGKLKAKGQTPKSNAWKSRYVEPVPPDISELPILPQGWTWATLKQLVS